MLKEKCSLLHLIASTVDQTLFGTGLNKKKYMTQNLWLFHVDVW